MDDLITAADAATLLHLHVKRVQHLARTGELPATRFGHKWLFSRSKLLATPAPGAGHDEPMGALEISARNKLRGRISSIVADGVMAEVRIQVADQEIVSIITRSSAERLRLSVGDEEKCHDSQTVYHHVRGQLLGHRAARTSIQGCPARIARTQFLTLRRCRGPRQAAKAYGQGQRA